MTRVSNESSGQYWEPISIGPVAQIDFSANAAALGSLPTVGTIPASTGHYTTLPIYADGFKAIGVGCKSTQTGVITIQRYLDSAGVVPVGAPVTANLTANTAQWLTVNDNVPFQSFTVDISNTGAGAATITNFGLIVGAN